MKGSAAMGEKACEDIGIRTTNTHYEDIRRLVKIMQDSFFIVQLYF